MTVGGSWGAVGRDCRVIDDGGHDFDDEFGELAAGGANRRRVVGELTLSSECCVMSTSAIRSRR